MPVHQVEPEFPIEVQLCCYKIYCELLIQCFKDKSNLKSIIPTFYPSLHRNQSLKNTLHLCGSLEVK